MDTRIAVMSIIVENPQSVETLNSLLHTYSEYIIGHMGIPYHATDRKVNMISIALDTPQDRKRLGSMTPDVFHRLNMFRTSNVYV